MHARGIPSSWGLYTRGTWGPRWSEARITVSKQRAMATKRRTEHNSPRKPEVPVVEAASTDEPSGGMNHAERSHVAHQIIRIKRELGVSQVLIEHDLRFVKELCDYVYVLNFGEVLTEGPPEIALNHSGVVEVYGGGSLPSRK